MPAPETPDRAPADPPVVIATNDARGARGPGETSRGDTLLPMLIGGLLLCIVGGIIVALLV